LIATLTRLARGDGICTRSLDESLEKSTFRTASALPTLVGNMASATLQVPAGSPSTPSVGVNLAFTSFLFVRLRYEDADTHLALRAASDAIGRGYFNTFALEGGPRDAAPHETIQFLTLAPEAVIRNTVPGGGRPIPGYCAHVSSRVRSRLPEVEKELIRRVHT